MTTTAIALAIALLLLAAAALSHRYGGNMPEPYRSRSCQGAAWKRRFPCPSNDEVRTFLTTFSESFAFRESQKLQVGPEDEIIAIYRALYPKGGGIDALELETFAGKIERRYKLAFGDAWNENLTFGQLFEKCRSPVATVAPPSEA